MMQDGRVANEVKQPPVIWWMLWIALLSGVFVLYFVIGGKQAPASDSAADSPAWMVGIGAFVVSCVIRWLVLPRVEVMQTALSLFVVGMAVAEAACILGLFIFPAHKQELFVLGVLGIGQFAPYFASRFPEHGGGNFLE